MTRLFGTDGVRGVANSELSVELAVAIGRAAAKTLSEGRGRFLIGRDTRLSGPMLGAALSAGMMSAGASVDDLGILPTPALAYLVQVEKAEAGVVISASHNPVEDNGIKFFGPDGFKLTDAQEDEIQRAMTASWAPPSGEQVGTISYQSDAADRYIAHALSSLAGASLANIKVVVDCAHGAAFHTTPEALRRAGAQVVAINDDPDGAKINVKCGSTAPEVAAEAVIESGAHLGLTHDGDADRVIAIDERGAIVDGDAMIAALALDLKRRGELENNLVVSTVMANLGLRKAMSQAGIELIETAVGDRYVIEAMRENRAVIGGEQSGHIILLQHSTTGDGLITGLALLRMIVETSQPLSELAGAVERFPQVLLNVRVADRSGLSSAERVWEAVDRESDLLGDNGRVLVRASGTEPVVRVMVEALDQATAERTAERLAQVITEALGEVV